MPDEMRLLLNAYPRQDWEAHPGFRDMTRQWLAAHRYFRRTAERVRLDTEALLNKDMAPTDYAKRLNRHGGDLVGHLHGHHAWEDYSYFPELSAADPRFDAGLEILEKDHADLDKVLDDFTQHGTTLLRLVSEDESRAMDEAGAVHRQSLAIEAFLERHLSDEEDLAVPIILHHRLRG